MKLKGYGARFLVAPKYAWLSIWQQFFSVKWRSVVNSLNNYRDCWNTRIFLVTKISYAVKIHILFFTCGDKVVRTTSVSVSRKLRFQRRIFSINHFYLHIFKYNSVAFFFTNISCRLVITFQIRVNPAYFYEYFMSSCSYILNTYKSHLFSLC